MVWKGHTFSRNHTLNFESWYFPWLLICIPIFSHWCSASALSCIFLSNLRLLDKQSIFYRILFCQGWRDIVFCVLASNHLYMIPSRVCLWDIQHFFYTTDFVLSYHVQQIRWTLDLWYFQLITSLSGCTLMVSWGASVMPRWTFESKFTLHKIVRQNNTYQCHNKSTF